jgi:cytochrome P450 PksS
VSAIVSEPTVTLPARFSDPAFRADPYPVYARMRHTAPVYKMKASLGAEPYLITRYQDVVDALKDPRYSSDPKKNQQPGENRMKAWWMPRVFGILQDSMITSDDPAHQRLRGLVHLAFTPKRIEHITGRIEQITHELLDHAGRQNEIDLVKEFALPLPLTIISDLMGVPEEERQPFYRAVSPFLESLAGSPLTMLAQYPNANRLLRFFQKMIALRRAEPQDDLITALVQAEQAGDRLSEDELLSMIFLLLLAGHETTVNLISNGTLALLEFPDQLQLLHDNPAIIDRAIEELLRYGNPVENGTNRFLTEDVTLHGVTMPKASNLMLMLASANRDEEAFANADRLDLTRSPNRHVAFGLGAHYCVGAPLARLEGKIAINALVQRYPNLKLTIPREQVPWRTAVAVRGVKALPVRLA